MNELRCEIHGEALDQDWLCGACLIVFKRAVWAIKAQGWPAPWWRNSPNPNEFCGFSKYHISEKPDDETLPKRRQAWRHLAEVAIRYYTAFGLYTGEWFPDERYDETLFGEPSEELV